ncbi:MAG: DNA-3-methyladenine glycosylase [Deltaproteobacteria bacterium]|jgi:DNA-3-methyladenine glycosylase II|nr:DNA-3-methyladenine glycosylase [Deltaproteobacteria bacterium]
MNPTRLIGVKTTGIYCLPSCPAKSPLPENIVYFKTPKQAERNGYRPCKRCFPDFPYGNWIDDDGAVLLKPPKEFDFKQCLRFLTRSPLELCHSVEGDLLFKLVKFDDQLSLLKIHIADSGYLCIDVLTPRPKKSIRARIAKFVWDWFDLDTSLKPFYRMAKKDPVLKQVTEKLYGLRIIKIGDLFEALCWAMIGQQINLTFAYTLKKRLVECFGEKVIVNKKAYYLFPAPQVISRLAVPDLRRLQFTGRKSEYIIELAGKIESGQLSKKTLLNEDQFDSVRENLVLLRGVGKWTAEYVCLRCLGDPNAFPVDDIGLQNAIKRELGLNEKPSVDEIYRYAAAWKTWKAYAAFYLWGSFV